jgi:hypothetical protein
MLDAQIKIARDALNIVTPEDWCQYTPLQIRQIHGCGPSTVDHLRLYLAARGLTLRDDATPTYWQQNLAAARIGGQIAATDTAVTLPFVILVDKQEQQPFSFAGCRADADQNYRPLIVPIRSVSLGPTHGDYAIEGMEGAAHIERKGLGDAVGTFLASPDTERFERWARTLEFLAGIQTAAVVVEASFGAMIASVQARGKRSKPALQKTLHRRVLAWQQDTRIPFVFCDSRRMAEQTSLAILRRHYRHATEIPESPDDSELDAAIAAL